MVNVRVNSNSDNITVRVNPGQTPKVPEVSYGGKGILPPSVMNQIYTNSNNINILYNISNTNSNTVNNIYNSLNTNIDITNTIYNLVNIQGDNIINILAHLDAANISYINLEYTTNTVADALNILLYITPVVNLSNNIGTVELGTIISNLTLTWTLNKSVISQSINNGIGSISTALRTLSLSSLNITSDTTYTITVNDGKNSVNSSSSILFRNRRFWGTSSTATPDSNLINLINYELSGTRSQTRTFNPNNEYIYFGWPSRFGTPTFIVGGLTNSAWEKTTISYTNSKGYTENYDIYRSTFLQNGSQQVIVQ